jgi:hypothetical protein
MLLLLLKLNTQAMSSQDVRTAASFCLCTDNFVLQAMAEAASFGSEFVALQICKALIVVLMYRLRIFGVPIDGPANIF